MNTDIDKFIIPSRKVSIVLPTLNGYPLIRRCISSIINQTNKNWELIIVNDGSNDIDTINYLDTLLDFRIKVIHLDKNRGLPNALNVGIRNSTGKYWTWISDDNEFIKEALSVLVNSFRSNIRFVYSNYLNIVEGTNNTKKWNSKYDTIKDVINNWKGLACYMWTMNAIRDIGYFDINIQGVEDYDYVIRTFIKYIGKIVKIEDYLYRYYIRKQSLSFTMKDKIKRLSKDIRNKYNSYIKTTIDRSLVKKVSRVELKEETLNRRYNKNSKIEIPLNSYKYDSNDVLCIKILINDKDSKNIIMKVDDIEVPCSNRLHNRKWINVNYIDPRLYNSMNILTIKLLDSTTIKKIDISLVGRSNIIFNDNLLQVNNKVYESEEKINMNVLSICDEFTIKNIRSLFRTDYISSDKVDDIDVDKYSLLFCESCWHGLENSWTYEFSNYGLRNHGTRIRKLVMKFKEKGIPTIFYNKEDPISYYDFRNVAGLFDMIITTADECIERYKRLYPEIEVVSLPFLINPKIHNPINSSNKMPRVGYPGSYYKKFNNRCLSMEKTIRKLSRFIRVEVYDRQYTLNKLCYQVSNYKMYQNMYEFPNNLTKYVYPRLTYMNVINDVYKRYKYCLNFNTVKDSKTMCSRRAIELAGCGTNIISDESVALKKIFGNKVIFIDDISNFNDIKDYPNINLDLYHITHMNYTYKHMFRIIFNYFGLPINLLHKKVCIIKGDNTILSDKVNNNYDIINYNNLNEKKVKKKYDYSIYLLDDLNYDIDYIRKLLLPIEYVDTNIVVSKNKTDCFSFNSKNYYSKVYVRNYKLDDLNNTFAINNNHYIDFNNITTNLHISFAVIEESIDCY
jgi:glycosyltransferase involved in cell wall biosynthesis